MTDMPTLILASRSPRRTRILNDIGIDHEVQPADIDESRRGGESPADYVRRMAVEKASAIAAAASRPAAAVLGADTVVSLDDEVFGKPADETAAVQMLTRLGGRTHKVMSAVALVACESVHSDVVTSDVRMRTISATEARRYWATGEPADKAGSYAVQGRAAVFVTNISGSYPAIVGLPVVETLQLLQLAGITPRWLGDSQHG